MSSQSNPCPACGGNLGWTVEAVIAHLDIHDDEAAERIASAISDASLLAVLHDLASGAITNRTPFEQLPGWVQRRTHVDAYNAVLGQALEADEQLEYEAAVADAESEGWPV